MSVLVRGMEMPTSCYECPVECEGDVCGITQGGCTWDVRPPHCPLIPVPPHGDLIDRDALMENGWLNLHKEVMRMGGYATIPHTAMDIIAHKIVKNAFTDGRTEIFSMTVTATMCPRCM